MLGHSDDTDLNALIYESHIFLHLWLHSGVKKGGREENSGKKKGLKILTYEEGKEESTETCVSVRKELLHDSRA